MLASFTIDPETFGLPLAAPKDLRGGDPERNAVVAKGVLAGGSGPVRDIVVLNAAAALTVAGIASEVADGLERAAESIDSGKAERALNSWVEVSNR
jgi:anthranilate phosphoribosyltransferase